MYTPKHFSSTDDWPKIEKLVRENSFATVLSHPENEHPFINHLPIIFDPDHQPAASHDKTLIGHMAKANPQWQHFQKNSQATFIFHGPHTYISPLWYRSGRDVPTWNYTVVHMKGHIQLLESFEEQIDILKKLSRFFEGESSTAWKFSLPPDLDRNSLSKAIVSFRFTPETIEAKFKLSQNRSKEDRLGVIEGLGSRSDEMSHAIRNLMLENER
ncbi:MAG: FMN-binding negative transcriptional regulator [Oligoflexia bacterium]|nr:FMN-binding negative transcriptional regulator [Oligoflexia bacterium]